MSSRQCLADRDTDHEPRARREHLDRQGHERAQAALRPEPDGPGRGRSERGAHDPPPGRGRAGDLRRRRTHGRDLPADARGGGRAHPGHPDRWHDPRELHRRRDRVGRTVSFRAPGAGVLGGRVAQLPCRARGRDRARRLCGGQRKPAPGGAERLLRQGGAARPRARRALHRGRLGRGARGGRRRGGLPGEAEPPGAVPTGGQGTGRRAGRGGCRIRARRAWCGRARGADSRQGGRRARVGRGRHPLARARGARAKPGRRRGRVSRRVRLAPVAGAGCRVGVPHGRRRGQRHGRDSRRRRCAASRMWRHSRCCSPRPGATERGARTRCCDAAEVRPGRRGPFRAAPRRSVRRRGSRPGRRSRGCWCAR